MAPGPMSALEDLRGVRRRAGDAQHPAGRAAPRRDRVARIARAVLEADRGVGAARRLDERRSRRRQRLARRFLVTRHHDRDVHPLQQARGVERLQRLDDDDVAAFHVDDARARRRALVDPLERLERAVGRENRVEVADQDEFRTGGGVNGDEVAGAMPRGAVHPLGLEAEAVELGAEDPADLAHAGKVLGAAVDVHHALEQRQRRVVVRVDPGRHQSFRRIAGLEHERGGKRGRPQPLESHADYYAVSAGGVDGRRGVTAPRARRWRIPQ